MRRKNVWLAMAVVFSAALTHAQVTGSGNTGTIPIWTGKSSLGNSKVAQIGGNIGINTKTPGAQLDVENPSTIPAIVGDSFAATGSTTGVLGLTASPDGTAVAGLADATTGTAIGGFFRTASSTGTALLGVATATTGAALGIYGQTSSPGSEAILGSQLATSGDGAGVAGDTASETGGAGLVGRATATTGSAQAVFADTNSPNGIVALFRAHAGGDLVTGQFGPDTAAFNVFRIDSTGKGFFDGGTQTGGADFAESISVAKEFNAHEPGDLLIVDATGRRQLKLSTEPYSTLVAGIYSTKPGVLATTHKMNETASNEIPLAIVGIVPCKVSAENGPIQAGDLLVTSATPGRAMKGTDRSRMLGAVVGKALEPLSDGKGVIQVLVTLQ